MTQPSEKNWEQALSEFNSDNLRPGIWAKAFAEALGDKEVAKAKYLSYRAQQLEDGSTSENIESETEKRVFVGQAQENNFVELAKNPSVKFLTVKQTLYILAGLIVICGIAIFCYNKFNTSNTNISSTTYFEPALPNNPPVQASKLTADELAIVNSWGMESKYAKETWAPCMKGMELGKASKIIFLNKFGSENGVTYKLKIQKISPENNLDVNSGSFVECELKGQDVIAMRYYSP